MIPVWLKRMLQQAAPSPTPTSCSICGGYLVNNASPDEQQRPCACNGQVGTTTTSISPRDRQHQETFSRLLEVTRSPGVAVRMVSHVPDPLSRGLYNSDPRVISLVKGWDLDSLCRTLVHELAHCLTPGCYIQNPNVEECELVADSVTLLVGRELGLDTETCSTIWSNSLYDAERTHLETEVNRISWQLAQAIGLEVVQEAAS